MSLITTDSIEKFCQIYRRYHAGEPIPRDLQQAKVELETSFRENPVIKSEKLLLIEAGVGVGRISEVPWLAIMDPRETGTVQRGAAVVILFRKDMSGFYLCLGCGIAEFKSRPNGTLLLAQALGNLRHFAGELEQRGFVFGNDIDLRAQSGELANSYKLGTATFKLYEAGNMPGPDELFQDLAAVIAAYGKYVDHKLNPQAAPLAAQVQNVQPAFTDKNKTAWFFQIDPAIYDIDSALRVLPEIECVVRNYAEEIQEGDKAYLWRAGQDRSGLLASASILAEAEVRKPLNSNLMFYRNADYANNPIARITVQLDKVFENPAGTEDLLSFPVLRDLVARQAYGSNLRLSSAEQQAIEALLRGEAPPVQPLIETARKEVIQPARSGDYVAPSFEQIKSNIKQAGLRLDDRLIRRYHLALHSRGFVVLAGMSGTGKTWLTKAYADAVSATYELVCVAPNWNSNEHLLGQVSSFKKNEYIDTSFSYFLRQASDAYLNAKEVGLNARPFHVVLDEMNLARVEYYFALFLSKMEERARAGVASLRLGRDEVLLTPNLYFIGTVNVDETTHGFSDKVFDRAQLIELEATEDLIEEHIAHKPYCEMLMTIWRIIHNVAPFSFRVIDDIMAYVDHAEAISASWQDAFDEQITQKVLPKTKGKDAGTEEALKQLAEYCRDKLPFTHKKILAMLATRDRNGDISFFT